MVKSRRGIENVIITAANGFGIWWLLMKDEISKTMITEVTIAIGLIALALGILIAFLCDQLAEFLFNRKHKNKWD
jgi:hypothetical protein